MIPASVRIGGSAWETALFAKDGGYVIPIKDAYRKAEQLALGDVVAVRLASDADAQAAGRQVAVMRLNSARSAAAVAGSPHRTRK